MQQDNRFSNWQRTIVLFLNQRTSFPSCQGALLRARSWTALESATVWAVTLNAVTSAACLFIIDTKSDIISIARSLWNHDNDNSVFLFFVFFLMRVMSLWTVCEQLFLSPCSGWRQTCHYTETSRRGKYHVVSCIRLNWSDNKQYCELSEATTRVCCCRK